MVNCFDFRSFDKPLGGGLVEERHDIVYVLKKNM